MTQEPSLLPIRIPLLRARICVVGVGGAGCSVVERMMGNNAGLDFIACNTALKSLRDHPARSVQLGPQITHGRSSGASVEIGRAAAIAVRDEIMHALAGADLVFIAAGMGRGTGTGAAPVIAGVARELGCLSVAVVTRPFAFEGRRRAAVADEGIAALLEVADAVLVVPNERLFAELPRGASMLEAFRRADEVLSDAVSGISDVITKPGYINIDFADVRAILQDAGMAAIGMGIASGGDRAPRAITQALRGGLLEAGAIRDAGALLINLVVPPDFTLVELAAAFEHVEAAAHVSAQIRMGVAIAASENDSVRVTVVAAGISSESSPARSEPVRRPT